jgi:hypothetical protein
MRPFLNISLAGRGNRYFLSSYIAEREEKKEGVREDHDRQS